MVWRSVKGKIDKERLDTLGLTCWGGNSGRKLLGDKKDNGGLTYHVFNKDKSFDFEVSSEDFKNVDKVYKSWKTKYRKDKLEKIKQYGKRN